MIRQIAILGLCVLWTNRAMPQATRGRADTTVVRTSLDVVGRMSHRFTVDWTLTPENVNASLALTRVHQFVVAGDGRIAVADLAGSVLLMIDSTGRSAKRVGRVGDGPGEYRRLSAITFLRDGRLVVWDGMSQRLLTYARDGTSLATRRVPVRGPQFAISLREDRQGRLWARASNDVAIRLDSLSERPDTIRAASADSTWVLRARNPSTRANRDMVIPFAPLPNFALNHDASWVIADGRSYVIHTAREGKPLQIQREWPPVPLATEERAERRAGIELTMRAVQPDWTWNGPDFPREKPPFREIHVDLDNRIWVALQIASERFNPPPPSGRGQSQVVHYRPKEKQWDVFAPNGELFAHLVAPISDSFVWFEARGNVAWGTMVDDDGVPSIVRVRFAPATSR